MSCGCNDNTFQGVFNKDIIIERDSDLIIDIQGKRSDGSAVNLTEGQLNLRVYEPGLSGELLFHYEDTEWIKSKSDSGLAFEDVALLIVKKTSQYLTDLKRNRPYPFTINFVKTAENAAEPVWNANIIKR